MQKQSTIRSTNLFFFLSLPINQYTNILMYHYAYTPINQNPHLTA